MTIFTDLHAFLLADPTIAASIGTRMYPQVLPQNVTFPAISYSLTSRESVRELPNGPAGRARPQITISAWALDYIDATALADAIRIRLDGFKGAMGASMVGSTMLERTFDFYEDDVKAHRIISDYVLSHLET